MAREIYLPTELTDQIFIFLLDDKSTTSACTLLSSRWHASARRALFHTITLRYEFAYQLDVDAIRPPLNTGQYVKDLKLVSTKDRSDITIHHLDKILSIFPDVHTFTLCGADLRLLSDKHPPIAAWSSPRSLQELRLHNVGYYVLDWSSRVPSDDNRFKYWAPEPDVDTARFKYEPSGCSLVQFLNLFGRVDTISLSKIFPIGTGDQGYYALSCGRWPVDYSWYHLPAFRSTLWAEEQKLSERFCVRRILASEKEREDSYSLAEMALYILAFSPTATVDLQCLELSEPLTVTNEILQRTASTLTKLRLQLLELMQETLPNGSESGDKFGIIHCIALTDLHIHLFIPIHGYSRYRWNDPGVSDEVLERQNRLFNDFIHVISISPKTFRHITLEVKCLKDFLLRYDWSGLDKTLIRCLDLVRVSLVLSVYTLNPTNSLGDVGGITKRV
ncbi:hypothetical protein BXZ70DRAFT_929693, partial [Cristinia sonorae]